MDPDLLGELRNRYILEHEEEEQRQEQIRINRISMRQLRDDSDPFALPDGVFTGKYRLSKDLVRSLIEELRPFLQEPERMTGVPVQLKVKFSYIL